jgi:hypothetical protein
MILIEDDIVVLASQLRENQLLSTRARTSEDEGSEYPYIFVHSNKIPGCLP